MDYPSWLVILFHAGDCISGRHIQGKNGATEKCSEIYPIYNLFPIIIQGPISRYNQLGSQLFEEHEYDNQRVMRGIQLIIWGLFLKYMIADKTSVVVDAVFDSYRDYSGLYILIATILYSVQLYADFLSCVTMAQGVAGLFGIELIDNFQHPYFSTSIKEFWRRWHISLSEWLRDYVYIPLGGNRKRKVQKCINLTASRRPDKHC